MYDNNKSSISNLIVSEKIPSNFFLYTYPVNNSPTVILPLKAHLKLLKITPLNKHTL